MDCKPPVPPPLMSSPFHLLGAAVLLLALVLVPAGLLGLCCVVTLLGACFFLGLFLLGLGPLCWYVGHERDRQDWRSWGQALLVVSVCLGGVVLFKAPSGRAAEASGMHTRYSDGGWHYDRTGLSNLLPELDQIHLGYAAARVIDPLFTRKQQQSLAQMTDELYAEMQTHEDFTTAGSALGSIYQELTFAEFRDGHYFHYIPKSLDRRKPAPALVFLHGSGGNFKAYTWLLRQVAEEVGCTLIAPSFGLGNWNRAGASRQIAAALADATQHAAIDPQQIHLMGLSNGGLGVCLAPALLDAAELPAALKPLQLRSLIFLSGVFSTRQSGATLAQRLSSSPVLIISGGRDDRVPWDYVHSYGQQLQSAGMQVTMKAFPEEDHFLFFHERAAVIQLVTDWLKQARR